ncbi:MAG: response regulator [Acidobacteriota bacterium]
MTSSNRGRVLVVDDDPEIRGLLASVLRRSGLTVDLAADGHEAFAMVREHRYSVILLDLMMPGADGFEVLRGLRDSEQQVPPVVLVVTGADREALERLDAHVIHGIVRKPFDPEEVASIVVACVEIRGRNALSTMAIATMMAGGPILAILQRLSS